MKGTDVSPKLMLVDDDVTILALLEAMFEDEGFEVVCRKDALGTSVEIVREQPDVIILDLDMPALSGERLAVLLRDREITTNMKVVLYSSAGEARLKAVAVRLGAAAYVSKSSGPRALRKVVRDIFPRGRV